MKHPESKKESDGIMAFPASGGKEDVGAFRRALLTWYGKHARVLPWRAGRGETPDPYHVWLSEIMLQQTVVAAVIPYFLRFIEKWPGVNDLAAADRDEVMEAWAGLGYYSRARNLHKCAQIVASEYGGRFPEEQAALKKLPGIGDYTCAAVVSIAFNKPAVVVDGNVERVLARYFAVKEPFPGSKPAVRMLAALLSEGREDRPGDFAQAMMDLGAGLCTPRSPKCALCPVKNGCRARAAGIQEQLPYKRKRAEKPVKFGHIYWVRNDSGCVLLEKRSEKGMLAGTTGLPVSEWVTDRKELKHPPHFAKLISTNRSTVTIHHSFTHFNLELTGHLIEVKEKNTTSFDNPHWFWKEEKTIINIGIPSLFKKFVNLMLHDGVVGKNT